MIGEVYYLVNSLLHVPFVNGRHVSKPKKTYLYITFVLAVTSLFGFFVSTECFTDMKLDDFGKLTISVITYLSFLVVYISLLSQYDVFLKTAEEISLLIHVHKICDDKIQESLCKLVGFWLCSLFIIALIRVFVWFATGCQTSHSFVFLFSTPILLYGDFAIQMFLYYIKILQYLFFNINNELQYRLNHNNVTELKVTVEHLAAHHNYLCEMCLKISTIYASQLIAKVTEIFIILTFGYFFTIVIINLIIFNSLVILPIMLFWSLFFVIKLTEILWICSEAAEEVR